MKRTAITVLALVGLYALASASTFPTASFPRALQLVNEQVFTTSGNYVEYAPGGLQVGARYLHVRMCGGGGGGGGAKAGAAGGASAGSYVDLWLDAQVTSAWNPGLGIIGGSVTIGAAGTAGTPAPTAGGNGGDTTFTFEGTTYTAKGGLGSSTGITLASAGAAGQSGSTTGDINIDGMPGTSGISPSSTLGVSGNGGSSPFGTGGVGVRYNSSDVAGIAGQGHCSGGSGGASFGGGAAGGSGTSGMIVIEEYQ